MSDGAEPPRPQLFDRGLQPERTALAWRRTGLALTVASLVAVRVLPEALGAWTAVPAGMGIVLALVVLGASHHRQALVHRILVESASDRVPLPAGGLLLLVTLTTCGGGLAALFAVASTRL